MKKIFYYFLMLFTATALSLSFVGCGEDDEPVNEPGSGTTDGGGGNNGGSNNGNGNNGGDNNTNRPAQKQLISMEYTDNEKGELGSDVERYTGNYDSKGRVTKIIANYGNGREYHIDYVWSGSMVENIQEGIRYMLSDGKVSTITWDEVITIFLITPTVASARWKVWTMAIRRPITWFGIKIVL